MTDDLLIDMIRRIDKLEARMDSIDWPSQGYHYQPITLIQGWAASANEASQTIDLQAAPWSLPAGIKAVAVYLGYNAANNGDYGLLEITSGNGQEVIAQCPDANEWGRGAGMVNCDGNGDIYFTTNNATNTVDLYIFGYFI